MSAVTASQKAIELALDPNASLYEVVFSVPAQQKIALFTKQRKRFAEYSHAVRFLEMHAHVPPLGTHLAIFKGTRDEIERRPDVISFDTLIDLEDDYGGKMAHECEWQVMRFNIETQQIEELVEDEQFLFPDKAPAVKCARFIIDHCKLIADKDSKKLRVVTTNRSRSHVHHHGQLPEDSDEPEVTATVK